MSKEKKSFQNRAEDEAKEGYKTVNTDLPSDRFQDKKQVLGPDEMGITPESQPKDTANMAEKAAKSIKSKIKLRPDVSVDDLGDKQVGGVPLAATTGLRNAAGARSLSPADDNSRTPYSAGGYRPETRYGKKRSEDLFELDNTISEQVVPVVDDLPDLRNAPGDPVGYNGRQQFKQTRQKKNFNYTNGTGHNVGKLPQQLLNDASVDMYTVRNVVYTTGQIVTPVGANGAQANIDPQADYPTYDGEQTLTGDNIMHKSNYMPYRLRINVTNGHIHSINIDEFKFNAPASATVRDEANMNWQIDANNVAKTVIKLQTELGRETTDQWSPLGYVITQPYEFNMLMHDIEASTGAIQAIAYRAAVSSLAYQRNITRKDGVNMQRNAVKMIYEGFAGVLANNCRNTISDLAFDHVIFNRAAYQAGAASALIAMFDSTGKYHTKADLLGLQRSFGLHLSQMDNNLNPLHCKPEFIKSLDKQHMFSSPDGSYNAFLPIYETKDMHIINPLSLQRFLDHWKNPYEFTDADRADTRRSQETGTYAQYIYSYRDLRNVYETKVQHPIIEGLIAWLLKHEGAIVSTYGEGDITMPFAFDFQAPAMLQFLLCSAAQDVTRARNIAFRDILFAGDQSKYIWDDLVGLDKLNPLFSTQLRIGKYDEPLELGKLANDTLIRVMFGDHKQLSDRANGLLQYYEPWYLNEQAFAHTAGGEYNLASGFFDRDHPYNASFPSIRDGVRHEFIDLIKSMKPKDVYLSMDRKLDILRFSNAVTITAPSGQARYIEITPYMGTTDNAGKIKVSTLRYDGNSDGRIVTKYDLDAGNDYNLSALGFYCIPKELGFIDDYYGGITVINSISSTYSNNKYTATWDATNSNAENIDTSGVNTYYYNGGKACWLTSYRVETNGDLAGAIDRSASLTQTFYRFFGDPNFAAVNVDFINNTGLVPTRSYNDGANVVVPGIYNLGSNNESSYALDVNVVTDAQFIWTTLQRWFLPMNPFANAFSIDVAAHSHDPFETSFWFGLCAFLAADYTQAVLERLSIHDQLGMDFTEDPNIKDSPIFH